MHKEDLITGGCLCGAIRFEVSEPPTTAGFCHCRQCQRWTGGPATGGVRFPRAAFRFIRGEPKIYHASVISERYFCSDCGSPLIFHPLFPPYGPDFFYVKIGTLDEPENIKPQFHYGIEGHLSSWLPLDDELPRIRCEEDEGLRQMWEAAGKTE
jgi:adenylate cyclase